MNKASLLVFLPFLFSCSTIPTGKDETIDKAFGSPPKANAVIEPHTPPAEVTSALLPDLKQTLWDSHSQPNSLRFDLSLHEVNAREFFMGLVIDTDENMIVHPDVSGAISLNLKNVTIAQVMEAVQRVYGYDFRKTDIGYIVYPSTIQTRVFKIHRLDLTRGGQSDTRVTSGQISETEDSATSSNSNTGSNESPSQISSGSWISTKSQSDFWLETEAAIKSIISIDPQATVIINRQTGTVVVRAKPMQLREVEQFIEITQNQLTKEVIIEAKIIEVILNEAHQAGVHWEDVAKEAVKIYGPNLMRGVPTAIPLASDTDFSTFLDLMQSQGKTNILSSPRISTLNNQKAIIKVGNDEYFITNVSSNTVSTGSSTISNPDITWTQFFSGISLDVTPQINDQDEITLHIHPSVTRVESQTKEFVINGEDGSLPMALNAVRESDSIVKAENGQIVVIGGLMQETTVDYKEGLPLLSELPYIGYLFRVDAKKARKSELIILLKTTVIKSDSDWAPYRDTSQKELKQLQNHQLWQ